MDYRDISPDGPNWHTKLLDLAVQKFLLSTALRQDLKGFLAFRHFVRHAYSFELDPVMIDQILSQASRPMRLTAMPLCTLRKEDQVPLGQGIAARCQTAARAKRAHGPHRRALSLAIGAAIHHPVVCSNGNVHR